MNTGGLGNGAITGIAVGAAVGGIAIASLCSFFPWRHRKRKLAATSTANSSSEEEQKDAEISRKGKQEKSTLVDVKTAPQEMGSGRESHEMESGMERHEIGPGTERYETSAGGWQDRVELP